MEIFDTSYLSRWQRTEEKPARHGHLWSDSELRHLKELFLEGLNLQQMCERLQRSPSGLLPKLRQIGALSYDSISNIYRYTPRALKALRKIHLTPETLKEETMNINGPIVITNKTLINGEDLASKSDSELYALIAEQEFQVNKLNLINHKPKRLIAEIEKRNKGIEALVAYMDSKD